MSIYHRYAVFYCIQRYQADIDKLGDLLSQFDIVDNYSDNRITVNRDHPDTKSMIKTADGAADASHPRHGAENETDATQELRVREDVEESEIHEHDDDNHMPEGNRCRVSPNSKLDSQEKPGAGNGIGLDEVWNRPQEIPIATSAKPETEERPRLKFARSQLDRVRSCGRILQRLNAGLAKNIHRIETEENELSSESIRHLWSEAARLNGTEKIKPLRATTSWWENEARSEDTRSFSPTANNTARTTAVTSHRLPCSPLQNPIMANDLLWDDQVKQWQLGMGRLMDDQGRRYLKI
ncbi:uncharacterized protein SPSK_07838 [Sporothrix schenckii 1099-18]|uniref:Uncharacterized protein n=1 Tax=Sporothrix schenckii 1099-18 TaxID=1397361 RepID=A0A0F2MEZ8_SPOSC|nr:uncharacterized protein SPSK_07838 [Sporothrix schenckii 1099-18]KJR87649.1 hypothetical protein SPSK_07838 [Sporothrix schenckii 1099-18]